MADLATIAGITQEIDAFGGLKKLGEEMSAFFKSGDRTEEVEKAIELVSAIDGGVCDSPTERVEFEGLHRAYEYARTGADYGVAMHHVHHEMEEAAAYKDRPEVYAMELGKIGAKHQFLERYGLITSEQRAALDAHVFTDGAKAVLQEVSAAEVKELAEAIPASITLAKSGTLFETPRFLARFSEMKTRLAGLEGRDDLISPEDYAKLKQDVAYVDALQRKHAGEAPEAGTLLGDSQRTLQQDADTAAARAAEEKRANRPT